MDENEQIEADKDAKLTTLRGSNEEIRLKFKLSWNKMISQEHTIVIGVSITSMRLTKWWKWSKEDRRLCDKESISKEKSACAQCGSVSVIPTSRRISWYNMWAIMLRRVEASKPLSWRLDRSFLLAQSESRHLKCKSHFEDRFSQRLWSLKATLLIASLIVSEWNFYQRISLDTGSSNQCNEKVVSVGVLRIL